MNLDGWRELRILVAERDTTLNALAVEAFNDLLKMRTTTIATTCYD